MKNIRSSTYSEEIKLVPHARLKCDCGWSGRLDQAISHIIKDKNDIMRNERFCCPRQYCGQVLTSWSRIRDEKKKALEQKAADDLARKFTLLQKIRGK